MEQNVHYSRPQRRPSAGHNLPTSQHPPHDTDIYLEQLRQSHGVNKDDAGPASSLIGDAYQFQPMDRRMNDDIGLLPLGSERRNNSQPGKVTFDNMPVKMDSASTSTRPSSPTKSQFTINRSRRNTNLEEAPRDTFPFPHKYFIRRPRALQFSYKGRLVEAGEFEHPSVEDLEQRNVASRITSEASKSSHDSGSEDTSEEERSTDDIERQRERLDLFVDLLWVGIISNISEHFFNQVFSGASPPSHAVLEFILLFLPAWRMWSQLQEFLSSYYMDDFSQRIVVVWILVLGLIWGNNAPFLLNPGSSGSTSAYADYTIITYIISISSLYITEAIYSIWIPWVRRLVLIGCIISLPGLGLWVATTITRGWLQTWLFLGAILFDYGRVIATRSPLERILLGGELSRKMGAGFAKKMNEIHIRKRYECFFIVALGEGVFLLIRGSPLGVGYNDHTTRGVTALLAFYNLHWLYFNGDQERVFVHALHRRWYIRELWSLMHIPIYASLVLMSSAVLYLLDYTPDGESNGAPSERSTPSSTTTTSGEKLIRASFSLLRREGAGSQPTILTDKETLRIATVVYFATLSMFLFCSIVVALLNRPMHSPRRLVIQSRYLRLLARAAACVVFAVIWVADWDATAILGYSTIVLWIVSAWEAFVGRERGGGFIEGWGNKGD